MLACPRLSVPAPTPSENIALGVFATSDPNGTWQLFIVDDVGNNDTGSFAGGWSLTITAEVDVQERVKLKKDKKKRKR